MLVGRPWQILLQKSPMRTASCAGIEPEAWPTNRSVEATALTPSTRLQRDLALVELSVHLPPLPYALALAPPVESSPAPEIFFSKTPSVRKATPF
jgi:hypothetical protein